MNRRGFLATVGALLVAPVAALRPKPVQASSRYLMSTVTPIDWPLPPFDYRFRSNHVEKNRAEVERLYQTDGTGMIATLR